jgi:hypothetical protein
LSLASIEGVSSELAETFFREGWRSAAEVASAKPDELSGIAGVGGAAGEIITAAGKAAEIERLRMAEEAARAREAAALAEAAAAEAAAAAATATPEGGVVPPSPEAR